MAELIACESVDIDDQARALKGFHQRYEQLGRGRFHGSLWQLAMADGALLREATNRHLRQQVAPPREQVALAIPLAVAPGSQFAGRALGRDSLMVLGGTEEHDLAFAGAVDLVGFSVHRRLLETLAPAGAAWLQHAERSRHLWLAPPAAAAVRATLLAHCGEAGAAVARLQDRQREAGLLAGLLARTVELAAGAAQPDGLPRRSGTRQRVVRRAIEYMHEHLHEDIGVPEICAAACASRRSLQYCFEELLHTTPQACLRALRLNEARRRLKAAGTLPISQLASELGFSHASHFTQHYKRMFDELPSQTQQGGAPRPMAAEPVSRPR